MEFKSPIFIANVIVPLPTDEMRDFFSKRTKAHIARVKQNMLAMVGYKDLPLELLSSRADEHDASKFSEAERTGYIWLTWMHHCRVQGIPFVYPKGIEEIVAQACHHHLHNNLHHPEAHYDPDSMSELDIVEMVCDWTAMSQEYNQGGGSCKEYVDINLDKKWNFSAATKDLIYQVIEELDCRNGVNSSNKQQLTPSNNL